MAQPASDLAVDDLKGGYAGTQVLDGLSFRVGAGRKLGIPRAQRCRQDHHAGVHHGARRNPGRAHCVRRRRHHGDADLAPGSRRPRLRAADPRHLQIPQCGGKPRQRGAHRRGQQADRACLRAVPAAARAPQQQRHAIVRRRTADARGRARHHSGSGAAVDGRAAGGTGAAYSRRADGCHPQHGRGDRPRAASWSSSMSMWCWISPTRY